MWAGTGERMVAAAEFPGAAGRSSKIICTGGLHFQAQEHVEPGPQSAPRSVSLERHQSDCRVGAPAARPARVA